MAQIYQEWGQKIAENPLYQLSLEVSGYIRNSFGNEAECEYLFSGCMSLPQFANYLVFETVAQDIRDTQKGTAASLYSYVQEITNTDPDNPALNSSGIDETYTQFKRDLKLRTKFLHSFATRINLANSEELGWTYKMNDRSNFRSGYSFTELQLEQLHDRSDFYIKKVHELRRFAKPKHVPAADIKAYYSNLAAHAQARSKDPDPKWRVLYAVNLNDFECYNPSFFLAKVAEYCIKSGITDLDSDTNTFLLALTSVVVGNTSGSRWTVTHKPMLFLEQYISAAVHQDTTEMSRYLYLVLWGLQLRMEVIPTMLKKHPYTYEDVDLFIRAPASFFPYNVFELCREPEWDEKGQMVRLLRELIKTLTVDPLS